MSCHAIVAMQKLFRYACGFMAALFVFAAALQYNDPQPARWVAMYLIAAVPCVQAVFGRVRWPLPAAAAFAAFAWALLYALRGGWSVPFFDMFDEWEMKNQEVVQTREMFGLCIVGIWMVVVAIMAWRLKRSSR